MTANKKLPAYVYPCGIKYTVKLEHMDGDDYGWTAGDMKTIRLNTDPKKGKDRDRSLFHEYLHAVFYGTGLSQVLRGKPGNLEEAIVIALEEHIFKLIDVNKLGRKP